jgi:hypothetical protein
MQEPSKIDRGHSTGSTGAELIAPGFLSGLLV